MLLEPTSNPSQETAGGRRYQGNMKNDEKLLNGESSRAMKTNRLK